MSNRIFTSESVTEGHPDKICDQISDAVLDSIIANDKSARVACETIVSTGMALIMGEITTNTYVDIPEIARKTIKEIGYVNPEMGFDYNGCAILTSIKEQSPDIAMGVDNAFDDSSEEGAGDQGMMFGFACDENSGAYARAYFNGTLPVKKACRGTKKNGELSFLRPDGKTQVTVEYDDAGKIVCCPAIVVSTQHDPDVSTKEIRESIIESVIKPIIPAELISEYTKFFVNPTGRFVTGGPVGDSGLTGRKIIVDTYGGYASHGGGAFSGKDPSKVDRSAAYMARYVAKNIVAAGLAKACQIELAYAIGVASPVSVLADTRGTGVIPDEKIEEIINSLFDLRPSKIITKLDLRNPIYRQVAAYGHFGRDDLDLPWEKLDMAEKIKETAF